LFRPYVVQQFDGRPPVATRRFYRHRVLRIFPAYWFALTAIVIWMGIHFDSVRQTLSFYALLQVYGSGAALRPEFQPIYQAWSLATEIAFYALLPLFALGMRALLRARDARSQMRWLLAGCAGLYAVGVCFRAYLVAAEPSWTKQATLWLPAWIDVFALGMAIAVVSAYVEHSGRSPGGVRWIAKHPGLMWLAAGLVFAGICVMKPDPAVFAVSKRYLAQQTAYGTAAAFFLLPGVFGDPARGRIRAFLRNRVMVYLATVSLGFYLFHVAVLDKAQEWTDANPFHANFFEIIAIALPITLVIATFSYYVVERPFLRRKDPGRTSGRDRLRVLT
jgi:peptidoglycan/LPS O-acetylase OafA/YrhL